MYQAQANKPIRGGLGFLESLGDLSALPSPSAPWATLPSPRTSAWTLHAVVGKSQSQTAGGCTAVQAPCASYDPGQVAVGTKPRLSYPQNGHHAGAHPRSHSADRVRCPLSAPLRSHRRDVERPGAPFSWVPSSSFQLKCYLPVFQYVLNLLVLHHASPAWCFWALTLLGSCI